MKTEERTKNLISELSSEDFRQINLGPIIFKLVDSEEGAGWTAEKATRHVEEFKFFFFMHYKFPLQQFVPTKEIDTVWHYLIQDTALYRALCYKYLGRFLDHFPYLGSRGEGDKALLKSVFEETMQIFAENFSTFFDSSELSGLFQAAGCNGCSSHCGRCSGDSQASLSLEDLYLVRPSL